MPEKDFYKVLDIPVNASHDEIKKAYRKLALKYHPDTSPGGKVAEAWFREIHEAYRILSDPQRRSAYNQQRWYRESTVSNNALPPHTPEEMLRRCKALRNHIELVDHHRLNSSALQNYLLHLLNADNLEMLDKWKDAEHNAAIVQSLIVASNPLGYKRFVPVATRLSEISTGNSSVIEAILKEKKRASYWKNYQLVYVLIIAMILCFFIYLLGV